VSEDEFQRRRQEKIAEIRRTGKTWQWPDPIQRPHPEWTPAHLTVLAWAVFTVVLVVLVVTTW
jgi:hypothetical protein